MNRVQVFEKQLRNMLDLYKSKNEDYGNSFSKSFEEYGLTSPIIRLSDKLERLKSLNDKDYAQVEESIEDTLVDLANYAVMTLVEIEYTEKLDQIGFLTDYEK